jgi:predicted permease
MVMESFFRNLRQSLRILARQPGFAAVVVISLGLAIAANTTVFSFVNATLLRSVAARDPDRLVRIYTSLASGLRWASVSYPNYVDYRDQNRVFSGVAAEKPTPLVLGAAGTEQILGSLVTANYFPLVGIEPALGRTFAPEEDLPPRGTAVALLSHGFWQRHFGLDPHVAGKTLILNGNTFTVVGVAPAGFTGNNVGFVPDVWIPLATQPIAMPGEKFLTGRGINWLWVTARLKPGVSLKQAQSTMNNLAASLQRIYPKENEGTSLTLLPERQASIYPLARPGLLALAGLLQVVVGLVLLVACVNVAGLLVAKAAARQKEMGIRLSLGASRQLLIRQLLTESFVLAALAGGLGLMLATWFGKLVSSYRPPAQLPLSFDLSWDGKVLGFTLLATLFTALLFSLIPALQASRPNLVPALKQDGSGQQGYRRSRTRSLLLGTQVAISLVLLIGAGLFFRSLGNARAVDPGFKAENLLVASLNVGFNGYTEAEGLRFQDRLLDRLASLPGVRTVSLARLLPFDIISNTINASPSGYQQKTGEGKPQVDANLVSAHYFETMGTPLLSGRDFTRQDTHDAPLVAIVNEALAAKYWPKEPVVGKQLLVSGKMHSVIGMVKNGKYTSLSETARPYLYLPLSQNYQATMTIHLRSEGAPTSLVPALRREVTALDPRLLLYDVKPMSHQLDFALLPARVAGGMLMVMGALALFLAMIGMYAATAYALARRRREFGIRMALGAQSGQLLWLVIREGMRLTVAGIVVGLALAIVLVRFAASLLYGVSPFDMVTLLTAVLVLLGITLLANVFPALRAAHINPNRSLRLE